jgi:hypothetical protein
MIRWSFLTTIGAALGLLWASVAPAQVQAPKQQAPQPQLQAPQQQPKSSFSDADLKSFALAALDVQRIREAYLPKLEAAKTPNEQQEVRIAASNEMVQAVEQKGMSVEKFSEIAAQARERPEVADQIQKHLSAATGK